MKNALAVVAIVSGLTLTVMAGQPGLTEPVQVLPRDAFPAINHPLFESVTEADRYLADNELMIGLVGETEQRAYSTWQLDRHEIVNDTSSRDGRLPSPGDHSAVLASCMPDSLRAGR